MRFAFVALALVACGSDPPPPPADAAPDAPDVCACVDTGPLVDVVPDAPKVDVPAPPDAATDALVDATLEASADTPSATDVTGDAPRCPSGLTGTCGGRSINFQMGFPQSDGTTLHCGRCGNTCASGTFCLMCVCER